MLSAPSLAVSFKPFDTRAFLPQEAPSAVILAILRELPVLTFDELSHKGDPATHEPECGSLEGCLLSLSEHPDDWDEIARTLKGSIWTVRLPDEPLRLIDVLRISRKSRSALRRAALELGLIRKVFGYKVSWWDDESECTRYYTTCVKSEADFELELEEGRTVSRTVVYLAKSRLGSYWGIRHSTRDFASDDVQCATISYFAEWASLHHGLWWQDDYDPADLSCPRGGIFQSLLPCVEVAPAL
jgi:hypothetical protein